MGKVQDGRVVEGFTSINYQRDMPTRSVEVPAKLITVNSTDSYKILDAPNIDWDYAELSYGTKVSYWGGYPIPSQDSWISGTVKHSEEIVDIENYLLSRTIYFDDIIVELLSDQDRVLPSIDVLYNGTKIGDTTNTAELFATTYPSAMYYSDNIYKDALNVAHPWNYIGNTMQVGTPATQFPVQIKTNSRWVGSQYSDLQTINITVDTFDYNIGNAVLNTSSNATKKIYKNVKKEDLFYEDAKGRLVLRDVTDMDIYVQENNAQKSFLKISYDELKEILNAVNPEGYSSAVPMSTYTLTRGTTDYEIVIDGAQSAQVKMQDWSILTFWVVSDIVPNTITTNDINNIKSVIYNEYNLDVYGVAASTATEYNSDIHSIYKLLKSKPGLTEILNSSVSDEGYSSFEFTDENKPANIGVDFDLDSVKNYTNIGISINATNKYKAITDSDLIKITVNKGNNAVKEFRLETGSDKTINNYTYKLSTGATGTRSEYFTNIPVFQKAGDVEEQTYCKISAALEFDETFDITHRVCPSYIKRAFYISSDDYTTDEQLRKINGTFNNLGTIHDLTVEEYVDDSYGRRIYQNGIFGTVFYQMWDFLKDNPSNKTGLDFKTGEWYYVTPKWSTLQNGGLTTFLTKKLKLNGVFYYGTKERGTFPRYLTPSFASIPLNITLMQTNYIRFYDNYSHYFTLEDELDRDNKPTGNKVAEPHICELTDNAKAWLKTKKVGDIETATIYYCDSDKDDIKFPITFTDFSTTVDLDNALSLKVNEIARTTYETNNISVQYLGITYIPTPILSEIGNSVSADLYSLSESGKSFVGVSTDNQGNVISGTPKVWSSTVKREADRNLVNSALPIEDEYAAMMIAADGVYSKYDLTAQFPDSKVAPIKMVGDQTTVNMIDENNEVIRTLDEEATPYTYNLYSGANAGVVFNTSFAKYPRENSITDVSPLQDGSQLIDADNEYYYAVFRLFSKENRSGEGFLYTSADAYYIIRIKRSSANSNQKFTWNNTAVEMTEGGEIVTTTPYVGDLIYLYNFINTQGLLSETLSTNFGKKYFYYTTTIENDLAGNEYITVTTTGGNKQRNIIETYTKDGVEITNAKIYKDGDTYERYVDGEKKTYASTNFLKDSFIVIEEFIDKDGNAVLCSNPTDATIGILIGLFMGNDEKMVRLKDSKQSFNIYKKPSEFSIGIRNDVSVDGTLNQRNRIGIPVKAYQDILFYSDSKAYENYRAYGTTGLENDVTDKYDVLRPYDMFIDNKLTFFISGLTTYKVKNHDPRTEDTTSQLLIWVDENNKGMLRMSFNTALEDGESPIIVFKYLEDSIYAYSENTIYIVNE